MNRSGNSCCARCGHILMVLCATCLSSSLYARDVTARDVTRIVNPTPAGLIAPATVAVDDEQFAIAAAYRSIRDFPAQTDATDESVIHIYRRGRGGWNLDQVVFNEVDTQDSTPRSIAIRGDLLALGVSGSDKTGLDRGRVTIYKRSTGRWIEDRILQPTSTLPGSRFGTTVDFAGPFIVVGAPGPNDGAPHGTIYVFDAADYSLVDAFTPEVGAGVREFGAVLDATTARVVVGAPDFNQAGSPPGAVFVYRHGDGAWKLEQVVQPPKGHGGEFASEVRITGGRMIGSARDARGVHVFDYDESERRWTHAEFLDAPDASPPIGMSLAMNTHRVFASSFTDSSVSIAEFSESGQSWTRELQYAVHTSADVPFAFFYGASMAMTDEFAVFTSVCDNRYKQPWSAFVINVNETTFADCNLNGRADGFDILVQRSEDCNVNGEPDECEGASVDCNGNTYCDVMEILFGNEPDCNNNLILDVCELQTDRDGDSIPDICDNCPDTPNESQSDCDGDDVGDACAVEAGFDTNCDFDGVPDNCLFGYLTGAAIADGLWLSSIGDIDSIVLQSFEVQPGAEFIDGISVHWSFRIPRKATLAVYTDPSGDGDPADAVLMRAIGVTSATVTDGWQTYRFAPTFVGEVGDRFFVGVADSTGSLLAVVEAYAADTTSVWTAAAPLNELDVNDPSSFTYGFSNSNTTMAIRAVSDLQWRCDCPSDIAGAGNTAHDGVVDEHDLVAVLDDWGPCGVACPPACLSDLNGDCSVDAFDLLTLLAVWGACE